MEKINNYVETRRLRGWTAQTSPLAELQINKDHVKKQFRLKTEDDSFLFSQKDEGVVAEVILITSILLELRLRRKK